VTNTKREEAAKFAGFIKGLGFNVYLAESGEYGFITDDSRSRVLSFTFSGYSQSTLSGNYTPPSCESGTGWGMNEETWQLKTAEDVRKALYATAPPHCGKGWKRYATVDDHLALYGASSKYREV
jgi:hypothetical protein